MLLAEVEKDAPPEEKAADYVPPEVKAKRISKPNEKVAASAK